MVRLDWFNLLPNFISMDYEQVHDVSFNYKLKSMKIDILEFSAHTHQPVEKI